MIISHITLPCKRDDIFTQSLALLLAPTDLWVEKVNNQLYAFLLKNGLNNVCKTMACNEARRTGC